MVTQMPYGFPRGAASKDVLRGVLPDGDFSRSAGPHRPCSSTVCCAPHVSCPQRGLTARRRAADLWSIRRCLCSRADKPEPVCRICRERSPSVARRLQPDWGCSPGAVRFRTTPSACRGVSEKFLPLPVPPAETLVPCSKTILSYSEICAVSGEMKQGLAKQFDAETNRHLHKMNRYLHIE